MKKVAVALFLTFSMMANAEDLTIESVERSSEACFEGKVRTDQLIECISSDLENWDKLLNQSYKTLMGKLDQEQKEILRDTQRAWIKYKDLEYKNIESLLKNAQGTIFHLVESSRKMEITKERAIQLNMHLVTIKNA